MHSVDVSEVEQIINHKYRVTNRFLDPRLHKTKKAQTRGKQENSAKAAADEAETASYFVLHGRHGHKVSSSMATR